MKNRIEDSIKNKPKINEIITRKGTHYPAFMSTEVKKKYLQHYSKAEMAQNRFNQFCIIAPGTISRQISCNGEKNCIFSRGPLHRNFIYKALSNFQDKILPTKYLL